ncbi:MAG: ABC transporter permease, partial [Longimicrobiales bacterium]|nr:ABC transporter permease [Longimicrobiales bacterium]
MAGRHPPRVAGRLLDLADPTGEVRGDLDEEYLLHRRREGGRLRADLWYWSQVVRSVPWLWRGKRSGGEGDPTPTPDLGQALRMLRRRPGPSLLIVATLGLALGINTSVYSLVLGVVLRPLPFENGERLIRIHPDELFYIDLAGALRVEDEASSIERVLPWGRSLFTLTDSDPAEELRGGVVAYDHFEALGTQPMLGRGFRLEDARARPSDAVILAHGAWTRRFGGDSTVVGQRIEVGGRSRTLIGVMGPDHVPMEPDWEAWAPLPEDPLAAAGNALALNALLRPGVPLATADDDIRRALVSAWAYGGYRATEEEVAGIGIVPLRQHLLGEVRTPLLVLLGAVGFVLVLACANVANLLLAQGRSRSAEIAVRASLGASRARILGQLATEVLILAFLGGALGLLLAVGLHEWASGRLPPDLPRADQWRVGAASVLYTLAASGVAALMAGALPAWKTAGGRQGARVLRGEADRNIGRASAALVGLQVSL